MIYCPDNIGRYTIREMITYMNRTFRGCATGSANIQRLVQLFCAPPLSGHCFWNYMHSGYMFILSRITYYYFLNCITCKQRKEAFVLQ